MTVNVITLFELLIINCAECNKTREFMLQILKIVTAVIDDVIMQSRDKNLKSFSH
jgi:hypothetical protein